jgi:hypothetical protein
MNTSLDIKKITDATVKLALFGAQKLSKASQQDTLNATLKKIQESIAQLNAEGTVTKDQLVKAIFQILAAGSDLSKSLYVQDLENLANQVYLIVTGNGGDFGTIWVDIQNLYNGKLKGLPAAEPNVAADAEALETGLITVLGYILQNLKLNGSTEEDIAAVIAGLTSGIDVILNPVANADGSVAQIVDVTTDEAVAAVYEVLEAIADLTGSHTPLAIEQLLQKIYAIIEGNQSNFVKFFQGIGVEIQAAILAKKAKKEAAQAAKAQ